MEILYGGIGFVVGVIATAVYCAGTRSQMQREHEIDLRSVETSRWAYERETSRQIAAMEKNHAAELLAAYKRGKESDGVVRDEKTGRMKSVKSKARRYGDKVTATK